MSAMRAPAIGNWSELMTPTGASPAWSSGGGRPSLAERIADGAAQIPAQRQALLGLLLGATLPATGHGCAALRPIWADEAMQRAYDMVHLVAALERRAPAREAAPVAVAAEYRLATELAGAYRALDVADDAGALPCSGVLRTAVRDLAELFGPAAGPLSLRTAIEPVSLPAYQRRALVLAGCKIVVESLRQAIEGGGARIAVVLSRTAPATGRLLVFAAAKHRAPGEPCWPSEIVHDLAGLLECDPVCSGPVASQTVTELTFRV